MRIPILPPALSLLPNFLVLILLSLPALTHAQFGQFFEHMFSGGGAGGGGGAGHHHRHQQEQDVASDAVWYKKTYEGGMSHLSILSIFPLPTRTRTRTRTRPS